MGKVDDNGGLHIGEGLVWFLNEQLKRDIRLLQSINKGRKELVKQTEEIDKIMDKAINDLEVHRKLLMTNIGVS